MIGQIILSGLFLFVIIWSSVRLAISPLIEKNLDNFQKEIPIRDLLEMNILTSNEFKNLDDKIKSSNIRESYNEKFNSYKCVLDNLKNDGHIDDKFYNEKVHKLKHYFEIDEDVSWL